MHDIYENPLCGRYASDEMKHLFSDDVKFSTWRKLWIALAEAEKELGLNITDEQIAQMKEHIHDIDYESAAAHEREVRHDVMAHVHTFGEAAPLAKPIIHLGATSCYVGDNTDVIRMRDGLLLIRKLLISAIAALADFAEKHKDLPTLAYTHFQAAQPTTVGKRATLWLNDLMLVPVSGQTYSRKVDFQVLAVLSGIAQSATKFSNDIRLLSHEKEVDEPFESKQIGSSAMAYKRNPMRSERICSLARYVICDLQNAAMTTTGQWFERTLDDSANKRLSVPEAFLATDAILSLYINVISGMRVYPEVIRKHLNEELPFMASENILMYCVREKGGDRQELHEAIRQYSVAAAQEIKMYGRPNNLLDQIRKDPLFDLTEEELQTLIDPSTFTGMSAQQTEKYLADVVRPVLAQHQDELGAEVEIKV